MKPSRRIVLWAVPLLLVAAWWWHGRAEPVAAASMPQGAAHAPRHIPPREAKARHGLPIADIVRFEAAMKQCQADMTVLRRQRWEALGAKGDAESRLTYALMAGTLDEGGQSSSSSALLDAAAAAAPDDTEIAWYRASHCAKDSGCDRDRAIGRVLELEPDNLDGWLMALNAASQRKESDAALQTLLERAAQAKYYDPRTGETFLRLYQAMQDLPLPESCATLAVAQGWQQFFGDSKRGPTAADMAAMWAVAGFLSEIRTLSPVATLCQPKDMPLAPERAAVCKPILAKLADGDNLMDQMVGTRVLVELTAGGSEGAHWRERYRNLRWLMDNAPRGTHFDHDDVVRQMTEGEIAFLQDWLRGQGRWPAPEGWLPADEYARSLIQTGRPPPKPQRR